MHLRLEDLLALRDGEGAEDAARHVESCAECAGRLEELREMRDLLKALPDPKPGRDLWPALRKAAEARRRRRWATGVAAAAAVVLLLATAVLLWTPRSRNSSAPAIKAFPSETRPQGDSGLPREVAQGEARPPVSAPGPEGGAKASGAPRVSAGADADQAELARLIQQSQRLESLLRHVEARPGVQSGWQAAAVTDLQDHLASLDGRIGAAAPQSNSKEMVGLWQKRVDLLGTLLDVQTEPQGQVRL